MLKNKSFFIFFALSLVMLMSVNNTVQAQDGVSFQNKLKAYLVISTTLDSHLFLFMKLMINKYVL